jgi:hypothetical protein
MHSEKVCLLFLSALPAVWMTFHSCRGCFNSLLVNALRVAILLSALSLPAFVTEAAGNTAQVLIDALNSLSRDDLKKHVLPAIQAQPAEG